MHRRQFKTGDANNGDLLSPAYLASTLLALEATLSESELTELTSSSKQAWLQCIEARREFHEHMSCIREAVQAYAGALERLQRVEEDMNRRPHTVEAAEALVGGKWGGRGGVVV